MSLDTKKYEVARLEAVVKISGGGTPSKQIGEYYQGTIPWVTPKDMKTWFIDDSEDHITENAIAASSTNLIPPNSVLVCIRSGVLAHTLPVGINRVPVTINQDLKAFRCCDKLLPSYLARFLKWYSPKLLSTVRGTTAHNLSMDVVKQIEIPLPPLSEQKRIADILDKADAIRRKRQEALKFRNHFLTSTFLDMFGDPATNPKNLPLRELSEFYVTPKDGTKCGPFGGALKKEEYTSTGVPVWNMDNISDDGSLVPNIRLWISQEKYEDLSSYSVKDGDVIISRAGTVGKMCVVRAGPKDSIISTNLIRLRLNSSLIPEFFVSLMVLFKGRAGRLKTGPDGAFTHMSTGVLDKITIPYPTVSAQGDYVSIMERMDRSTHRLTTAVTEADRLFNSLAQRAFKGEL